MEGMDAVYITFPYDVLDVVWEKGEVKVRAIFNGEVEGRGSLANRGMHTLSRCDSYNTMNILIVTNFVCKGEWI